MAKKRYVYLATNGDAYEWRVEGIFATADEAHRYVGLFALASTVERWEVGIPDMPMDPEVQPWRCAFDWEGKKMTCHPGGLSHAFIGHIDGWKWGNRGTTVYAKTEQEAYETALAIIEAKDGPHETWGEPQRGVR